MRERKVSVHSLRSPGGGNQYNQAAIEEEYFHLIKKKNSHFIGGDSSFV